MYTIFNKKKKHLRVATPTLGLVINWAALVAAACKSLEFINLTLDKCKSWSWTSPVLALTKRLYLKFYKNNNIYYHEKKFKLLTNLLFLGHIWQITICALHRHRVQLLYSNARQDLHHLVAFVTLKIIYYTILYLWYILSKVFSLF